MLIGAKLARSITTAELVHRVEGFRRLGKSYYNANKKKLTNAISSELQGFRRPK